MDKTEKISREGKNNKAETLFIRHTRLEELDCVMELYEKARQFMAQCGNVSQWAGGYPERELVMQDIHEQNSYVCLDDKGIVGVFYFAPGPDKTYEVITQGSWLNEEPYAVIHRIAIGEPGKGIAAFCYDWCMGRCDNLRIDTHANNIVMQRSLAKSGFIACGIIYIGTGKDDQRIAYHKVKTAIEIVVSKQKNGKEDEQLT